MVGGKFKLERAAGVLYDATLMSDRQACERWGIARSTLKSYRRRWATHPDLQAKLDEYRERRAQAWAERLPEALEQAVLFSHRAARQADPAAPEAIREVTRAVQVLSEVDLTHKVMQQRMQNGHPDSNGQAFLSDSL